MAVIKSFNKFLTYPLLERIGIIHLDDAKYQQDIIDITKEFLKVVNNLTQDYETININWFGYPYNGEYKLIKLHNKCNINTILLLIKDNSTIPGYNTTMIDFNKNIINTILTNLAAYDHGFYQYTESIETDKFGHYTKKYQINICTILLIYNKRTLYKNDYKSIIEHELKHIYDLQNIYKANNDLMNKDITVKDTKFENFIYYSIQGSLLSENMRTIDFDNLIYLNKNYKDKYSTDPYLIIPLMSDLLYYMNKSEISARLVLFLYTDDLSETKNLYIEYNKLCDNIIQYADNEVKGMINELILECDYSNIYGISFSDKKTSYISNTNKLFKFYKKRISHFIKMCDKLMTEKCSKFNTIPQGLNNIPLWIRDLK